MSHITVLIKKQRGPWVDPKWLAICGDCRWFRYDYHDEAKAAAHSHELSTQADEIIEGATA